MPIRLRSGLAAVFLSVATAQTANPTTVPVFLPGYGTGEWEALRGSIIESDDKATTYTLFCGEQTPAACVLDADFPLTFAEGPGTLRFDGTKSGQITAHLTCNLAGSTAATCTGSSSYGTGFREGSITGPTQTVWTRTLAARDIEWGVLTLTTPPAKAATTNLDDPTPVNSATVTAQTSVPSVSSSGTVSLARNRGCGLVLLAASLGTTVFLI